MSHLRFGHGLLVIVGLLCMLLMTGCDKAKETGDTQAVIRPVQSITLVDVRQMEGQGFPGQAQAAEEVDLSFRVSGPMIALPVQMGQSVKKGQLLGQIDPTDFEVKIRDLKGQMDSAKADMKYAEIQLAKLEKLLATQAATQQEVDQTRAQRDSTTGRITSLQAQLDNAVNALSYCQLKAPFDGVVAATYVENFQTVQANQAVVRLLDISRIELVVDVPESLISKAAYVTETEVIFDAFPDIKIPATIKEIGTEASRISRTYPVTLVMDQPKGVTILPGMSAIARGTKVSDQLLNSDEQEIPVTAVFKEDGKTFVWLLQGEGNERQAVKKQITVGALTERGVKVKGLKIGDTVATAGVHFMTVAQTVRLMNPVAEAKP
jgi:RND family efflux transporter MFP subunit